MQLQRKSFVFLLLSTLALVGGCGVAVPIIRYPVFWDNAPQSLAIAEFESYGKVPDCGQAVTDEVTRAFAFNGSYRVYDHRQLRAALNEAGFTGRFDRDQTRAARLLHQKTNIQAVLLGRVTDCYATSDLEVRHIGGYYGYGYGYGYRDYYEPYVFVYNRASVSIIASLVRIDGDVPSVIHVASASGYYESSGEYPNFGEMQCLALARKQAVDELLTQLAATATTVRVKPEKALRTASSQKPDGKWNWEDDFKASDETMYVLLTLPAICARNTFRITITRKNSPTELASEEILWMPEMSATGLALSFSPRKLAQTGRSGKYSIHFYSRTPAPLFSRSFEIKDD